MNEKQSRAAVRSLIRPFLGNIQNKSEKELRVTLVLVLLHYMELLGWYSKDLHREHELLMDVVLPLYGYLTMHREFFPAYDRVTKYKVRGNHEYEIHALGIESIQVVSYLSDMSSGYVPWGDMTLSEKMQVLQDMLKCVVFRYEAQEIEMSEIWDLAHGIPGRIARIKFGIGTDV